MSVEPSGSLYQLAKQGKLKDFASCILLLSCSTIALELQYVGVDGRTCVHELLSQDCPLSVLVSVRDATKVSTGENLFAKADHMGLLPMHVCAMISTRPDVLRWVLEQFPEAILRPFFGKSALEWARQNPNRGVNGRAIFKMLEDATGSQVAGSSAMEAGVEAGEEVRG